VGSLSLTHHGGRDQVLLCLTRTQGEASELHEVELYETVTRSSVVAVTAGSKRRRVAAAAAVTAFELVGSMILPGPLPLEPSTRGPIPALPLSKNLGSGSWAAATGCVVHTFSAAPGRIIDAQQTLPGDLVIGPDARSMPISQEKGAEANFIRGCVKSGFVSTLHIHPHTTAGWAAERKRTNEHTSTVILGDGETDGTPPGIFSGTFQDLYFFSDPLNSGLLFQEDFDENRLRAFTLDGACVWEYCPNEVDSEFVRDYAVLPGGLVAAISFTSLSVLRPLAPSQAWSLATNPDHEDKANAPTIVRAWDLSDLLEEVTDESWGYGKAREIFDRRKAGEMLSAGEEAFEGMWEDDHSEDANLRTTPDGRKLLANLWGQVISFLSISFCLLC
jgi:hypothetical protein